MAAGERKGPTGWVARIYEVVWLRDGRSYEMFSEPCRRRIEEIANDAFSRNLLDERQIVVLSYRVPFDGYIREPRESVGERLGIKVGAIADLERRAYRDLGRYLKNS